MSKYWFFHHDNPDWRYRRKWNFCLLFDGRLNGHPIEKELWSRQPVLKRYSDTVKISISERDDEYGSFRHDLYEDFPWCPTNGGKYIVVSPPARAVFDVVAAGVFEYLPIEYTRPLSKRTQPIQLWLAHWLVCVDCLDREQSRWTRRDGDDEVYFFDFEGVVVRRSLIPSNMHIFELKHEGRLIFSDEAKRAVTKAKLVGAKFYPVPLSE